MTISIIAAVARNRVIGKDNDLVWRLPDDMKFFKSQTKGRHVIMGRKNWESLPAKWQPLPHRHNIVITRNVSYQAAVPIVPSLEEALSIAKANGEEEAYIIGGGEIYRLGFEYADRLYITEVNAAPKGDTFFPEWDRSEWKEVRREHHPKDVNHEFDFDFVVYEKIKE